MNNIRTTKMEQAREVERLVQKGPYIRVLARPPDAGRKPPIHGKEGNRISLVPTVSPSQLLTVCIRSRAASTEASASRTTRILYATRKRTSGQLISPSRHSFS